MVDLLILISRMFCSFGEHRQKFTGGTKSFTAILLLDGTFHIMYT